MKIGDMVSRAPDPRPKGFLLDPRYVGKVKRIYKNAGVTYLDVDFGPGRAKMSYPDDEWFQVK